MKPFLSRLRDPMTPLFVALLIAWALFAYWLGGILAIAGWMLLAVLVAFVVTRALPR